MRQIGGRICMLVGNRGHDPALHLGAGVGGSHDTSKVLRAVAVPGSWINQPQ